MNYVEQVIDFTNRAMPDEDQKLIRLYALLVLTKGCNTTMKDVHDAWSLWRSQTCPDHPCIVPFNLLDQETREKDRPYMKAIHAVAWLMSDEDYGGPAGKDGSAGKGDRP